MDELYSRLPRWLPVSLICIGVAMTLAMLCYPMGYDHAVFQLGGELVQQGRIPWRDFLDTKPPFVFYIFAAVNALLAVNTWSFRAFDIVLQLLTAWYLYRVAHRYLTSDIALFSAALYLMMYAALGFWHTAQVEGFSSILTLACMDLVLRRSSIRNAMIFGVCLILLAGLKFTLVIAPFGMLFWLFRGKQKGRWSFSSMSMLISLLALAALVVLLALTGLLTAYAQVAIWLSHYSSIVRTSDSFFGGLWRFLLWAVLSPTPAISIAAVISVVRYYRHRFGEQEATLISLCIMICAASLLSVLIEGKMFEYQYSRMFIALAPLAAVGLASAVPYFSSIGRTLNVKRSLMLAGIVVLTLIMSPLLRVFSQTIPWTIVRISTHDAEARVQRRIPDYFASEQKQAGEYLKTRLSPNEQMFFWGNDVALYQYANRLPQTICLTATPLRTAWTPEEWKDTLCEQLRRNPPKYFVVQTGDAKPYITGSTYDSYAALVGWLRLRNLLFRSYSLDSTIGHFQIYRRTE